MVWNFCVMWRQRLHERFIALILCLAHEIIFLNNFFPVVLSLFTRVCFFLGCAWLDDEKFNQDWGKYFFKYFWELL